jgi:hypothetical protein
MKVAKTVAWDMLDSAIKDHDRRHPKKMVYPKGTVEEAVQQALNELGGTNENGLGKRGRK